MDNDILTIQSVIHSFYILILCGHINFIFYASYTFLETAYPFAQSFHQFGDFLAAEKEKDDQYDKQDFLCSYSKHHYQ